MLWPARATGALWWSPTTPVLTPVLREQTYAASVRLLVHAIITLQVLELLQGLATEHMSELVHDLTDSYVGKALGAIMFIEDMIDGDHD